MAAIATHKRRPVARSRDSQVVNLETLDKLRPETTVEAYHQLFMNVELLMGTMIEHGVTDEAITMINSARLAQYAKDVSELDKYLNEIIEAAKRFNAHSEQTAKKAEEERYSPEATVKRLKVGENPRRLRPPEGGTITTLVITARLSAGLLPSSAAILKAEQVYGPFWTIKARCFVIPRTTNANAASAFVKYRNARSKTQQRGYQFLMEYKLHQTTYRNCDIYMLPDLPKLVALRDTKILELGLATKEQMRIQDMEERLPIIEKAELVVSKLPKTVSAESKRYMVHRMVEGMLLEEKRKKLREARYTRDGHPKPVSAATRMLSEQRFAISTRLADMIKIAPQEIHKAIANRRFSEFVGQFLRMHGQTVWLEACDLYQEWWRLKKLSEI